ncbi:MAG TPA: polysulfide reductase NrfD [Bryobacteraceae bacterium]|nr:polysulfide reductase NrfD [Bryobacteraceae bacterium]HOQ44419.1 polysulfide reductase NrfD [Bryobacteraceae bacterium]HPU70738.1 polysulfide reductase NrfD [Bryobacteraceae bacterium]
MPERPTTGQLVPRPPVIAPDYTPGSVTDAISEIVLKKPHTVPWLAAFAVTSLVVLGFLAGIGVLLFVGVGIWGINIPVAWGFAITNFVWWIGIGHAGTLISAILLLLHQEWRNSINRFAEAMTVFAVTCAALFPLLHLGRAWLFYWLIPYPNLMSLWPQFRSPLVLDVFAISTYFTISLLFWYLGLIPDFATLRDQATSRFQRIFYGIFAMGWRGAGRHWHHYQMGYLLLAGLATPLVVSVHSVVSIDFAYALLPGWHSSIFPPYFVAGAIYSGFAMVITLTIPLRKFYGLDGLVTDRHIDNMAKLLLATGLVVDYGYLMEMFTAWYSAERYEMFTLYNRMTGPYAAVFWLVLAINIGVLQLLWIRRVRRHLLSLFVLSLVIQSAMWLERYMIIITALHRDFLPRSWGMFAGTFWDWLLVIGSIGLFFWLFLLFVRYIPMISIFEGREMVHKAAREAGVR